ncbi:MAG TPA: nickel pincer cofactor biosynthesis protein LarB [Candidatus Solibacter sp.]|jgi:NCAIR mutase (PurE)-related protein|nr:nickel pincer cofactor biosynthesis protein LarB [Candidatus Solibacter sp.]
MKEILERLLAGEFSVDEALRALDAERVEQVGELARLDPDRMRRKGVPEVVLASGKTPELTAELALRLLEVTGVALVSRVSAEHDAALAAAAPKGVIIDIFGSGRRLRTADLAEPVSGAIGILTGGSSDVDVAEEARMVAETMGVRVLRAYDVGVSALHRLAEPLEAMVEAGVDALVVAAGMEGALPTVVGGLVSAPVVAVPTSTGYGAGGNGLAALLSMLQTCSPGVTLVNIDNGVGAGAAAALIALRVHAARQAPVRESVEAP